MLSIDKEEVTLMVKIELWSSGGDFEKITNHALLQSD